MSVKLIQADCLPWLRAQPVDSVDLVVCSPPYENARTKSLNLVGEEWVAWALPRFEQCLRVCSGLVVWVVEGRTRNYQYSGTPILLATELIQRGYCARHPVAYRRVGIPGSGGPDYWRNDFEFILVFKREPGRLAWSDPTACGGPPKYSKGGRFSNRKQDGSRVNGREYPQLERVNPGTVIDIGSAGGGHLGDKLTHEHSAPYSEEIPRRFISSFCDPSGVTLDPFIGSGTTSVVAESLGRDVIGVDIDPVCIELCRRRHRHREVQQVALELTEQQEHYWGEAGRLLELARRRLGISGRSKALAEGDCSLLERLRGDEIAADLASEFPGVLGFEDPLDALYRLLVDPPSRKSPGELYEQAKGMVEEARAGESEAGAASQELIPF